uniref:Metalloendopeptidase n=1 Tax=Strongyloides venezuelensis TaxID=75913 RepID=A0A0K0FTB1_STRVS
MPLIIAAPINRQNFFTKGTECRSIDAENYERNKRDIIQDDYYRWKFPIYFYAQYDEFDYNQNYFYYFVENLYEAIEIIQNNTCVTFKGSWIPIQNEQGLNVRIRNFCSSKVGLQHPNKSQDIYLSMSCYGYKAYILHEIGHALGLIHEQSRSDRDKYVEINMDNVKKEDQNNFMKFNFTSNKNYSTSYDYGSLMHYHQDDFAIKKDAVVITSKLDSAYNKMMGQRIKMTFNDFKKINLYHCNKCYWVDEDGKINKTNYKYAQCKNGGYPHYNNCNKCICPVGYTGDLCQNIVSGSKECGKTAFYAETYQRNLFFRGKMICYIFLLARDAKNKIIIKIHSSNTPTENICTEDISNQIKYKRDKGNTGLLLCGQHNEIENLKSESNSVLIIYRGSSPKSHLYLTFKQFNKKREKKKS